MKNIVLYILLVLIATSCQPDLDYKIHGYTQKIIVEGYIANGEYPYVYLSLNVPLSEKVDSTNIRKYIISTAKVTVSDSIDPNANGAKTEILTSGWDFTQTRPHKYYGTDIKGEEGKTYYLTVEYGGYTLHAKTTIPYHTDIINFQTTPVNGNDTLRTLSMSLNVDSAKKNSYRVFTKKRKDDFYVITPFLYNSELTLSGTNNFIISPKPTKKDSSYAEGSYFVKGDSILVRLCTIDSVSTQFFKSLTLFSTATGIGNNFFIGEKDALKSNISSVGFGIWCGNGTTNRTYIIQ